MAGPLVDRSWLARQGEWPAAPWGDNDLVIRHNVQRLAVGQPHDVCRPAVHPHDRRHGVSFDIELRALGLDRRGRRLDRDRLGPGRLRNRPPKIPIGQLKPAPAIDIEQSQPRTPGDGHQRTAVQVQLHPSAT